MGCAARPFVTQKEICTFLASDSLSDEKTWAKVLVALPVAVARTTTFDLAGGTPQTKTGQCTRGRIKKEMRLVGSKHTRKDPLASGAAAG